MKTEIAMKYNRRIFPYYKGMGWDPLFYSAIIFLFLTQVKEIAPAKVMYAASIYSIFIIIFQIPSTILIEKIGSRKALILGTIFTAIQKVMMLFVNNFTFTITMAMLAFFIYYSFRGPYLILEDRYVTNFTNSSIRAQIISTNNLIKNIGKIIISFLGGLLLEFYTTGTAYLIVGIVGLIIILLVLRYMKTRIGLNPEEYSEEDINFNKLGK